MGRNRHWLFQRSTAVEEIAACSGYFHVVLSQVSLSGTGWEKCVSLWSVVWPWGLARFGSSAGVGRECKTGCNGTARVVMVSPVPDLCDLIMPSEVSHAPDLGSESYFPRSYCQGYCLCLYLAWLPVCSLNHPGNLANASCGYVGVFAMLWCLLPRLPALFATECWWVLRWRENRKKMSSGSS